MEMSTGPILEKSWEKFPGHIAPATIFAGFGIYALLKTLRLTQELPANRSFADVHIPFRNKNIVFNIGLVLCLVTVAGGLYHAAGEGIDMSLRLHIDLYMCFFMVGLASILESYGRLPPDSGRAALSLALFLASFVWNAHGVMMPEPVNRNVHVYLGYINLADAFAFGYSVMRTRSMLAHIMAWALLILQGIWLYVISFYLCCIELSEFMVEAHLALICALMGIAIIAVIAMADLPQVREAHNELDSIRDGRGHYEIVAKLNGSNHGGSHTTEESCELSHEEC